MLTHMVVWKYRGDIDSGTREEHVARLRSLSEVVPSIRSFDAGFDTLHLDRSYDSGLVAIFDDRAALDAYTVHPEHVAAAEFGRSISQHVLSVDFESEG
jgi:Stress responsive A/B Barrel Domain